jgi:hypothetical protein
LETTVKIAQYQVYALKDRPAMFSWMRRLADVVNDNSTISTSDVVHGLINALGHIVTRLNIPHSEVIETLTTCLQRMKSKEGGQAS